MMNSEDDLCTQTPDLGVKEKLTKYQLDDITPTFLFISLLHSFVAMLPSNGNSTSTLKAYPQCWETSE